MATPGGRSPPVCVDRESCKGTSHTCEACVVLPFRAELSKSVTVAPRVSPCVPDKVDGEV